MKADFIDEQQVKELLAQKALNLDGWAGIYGESSDSTHYFNSPHDRIELAYQAKEAALWVAPERWALCQFNDSNGLVDLDAVVFSYLFGADKALNFDDIDSVLVHYDHPFEAQNHLFSVIHYALIFQCHILIVSDTTESNCFLSVQDGQIAYFTKKISA